MDSDMYYITEVDIDDGKTYDDEDVKVFPNASNSAIEADNKKRKRTKFKVTNVEKRILAKLIEKEPVIWDKNDELHSNNLALVAAWNRIAREMPGFNVPQCKLIWRSLKDAVRYRQKKVIRDADTNEEYEPEEHWEFSDCMSFFMTAPSKRLRRSQPDNADLSEFGVSSANENDMERTETVPTELRMGDEAKTNRNDESSASESNYGYTANTRKKEQDPLAESVISISNSIREFVKRRIIDDKREKSPLKFEYIWQNLDRLFQKLPDEAVDELNVKFMQMAYERIPRGS